MIIICAYLADSLLNIGEIMKISNLILAALLCTPVIASAKPAQFYKPYKSKDTVENIQPKRYIVKDVNVTLSSKMNAPDFLNQDQIKQRYIQKLNADLKAKNLLADAETAQPIALSFDIAQKRVFAGEDLKFLGSNTGKKYAHSVMRYQSSLSHKDQELATLSSEDKISLGSKGSFGKIIRDLSGSGAPQNELEDIDGFAQHMVEQLPE